MTKSSPIKTAEAQRVLQLMDSTEDGADRYSEFVRLVAKESGKSIAQIEEELDPFI